MRHTFIIKEVDLTHENKEIVPHHEFIASDYRSLVSYGAFFHTGKEKKRCWTETILYYGRPEWEYIFDYETTRDSLLKVCGKDIGPPPETIKHESIWAFYKFINYDYKKKRYIT